LFGPGFCLLIDVDEPVRNHWRLRAMLKCYPGGIGRADMLIVS
jgi:hypothetical protein